MFRLSLKYFVIPYATLFVWFLIFMMATDHGSILIWVNEHRNDVFDAVFPYVTFIGDWVTLLIVGLALLFYRWRVSVIFLLSTASMLMISSFLKWVVFPNVPRPSVFFEGTTTLKPLEGIILNTLYSFPSGHTMAAFMMATFLALFVNNKKLSALLLFAAVLTAVSRIYLLQHFLRDVLAGSIIGVLIALVMVFSFKKFIEKGSEDRVSAKV